MPHATCHERTHQAEIADGYHRLSLAYALDPCAVVPLKLGGVSAALSTSPP